jgi:hypothetical protein
MIQIEVNIYGTNLSNKFLDYYDWYWLTQICVLVQIFKCIH